MKQICLLALMLIPLQLFPQTSMHSVLLMKETTRDYKTVIPKKIHETEKSPDSEFKRIKYYDTSGMEVREDRFTSDNRLESILTYTNDTINRRMLSRTIHYIGTYVKGKKTAEYVYDHGLLMKVVDKDENGNICFISEVLNDDIGNPVLLCGYDAESTPYGFETAEYDYENNTVTISIFSNDAELKHRKTVPLSRETKDHRYNENKDLVAWTSINVRRNDETMYEADYKYDKFGNITQEKRYRITEKPNGRRIRELERSFKRTYEY